MSPQASVGTPSYGTGQLWLGQLQRSLELMLPSQSLALHDRGHRRPVVGERLHAVLDDDARSPAQELVEGALVDVLEAPPAAHVVDQHGAVVSAPAHHVPEE